MALVNLKIVQHNVLNWKNHRVNLINIYNEIKPDVILLNSHGNKSNEKIKIYNYVTYQSNKLEERNNGCAIAVRLGIKHRIRELFYSDDSNPKIFVLLYLQAFWRWPITAGNLNTMGHELIVFTAVWSTAIR